MGSMFIGMDAGAAGGPGGFTMIITTTNTSTGSSNNDQFKLPLVSTGNYNFTVDWGDGNEDTITVWNQAETTHTYSSTGNYTVRISGTIEGWRFANSGDKLKVTEISDWGTLTITTDRAFDYCQNLTISTTNAPIISTTTLESCFRRCDAFTNEDFSGWDCSGVQSFKRFFYDCATFNGNVDDLVTSDATNLEAMFYGTAAFAQSISGWDTSGVTNMKEMCRISLGTAWTYNVGLLDWTAVTDATRMFVGVTLSTVLYDAILVAIEAQGVNNSVAFHGGFSKYTSGGASETARAALVADHSWTITDGGAV